MTIAINLDNDVLEQLRMSPEELDQEVRLMAAARLYERGLASTGRAAELAEVPRTLLLSRLGSFGVSVSDLTTKELREDLQNARAGGE